MEKLLTNAFINPALSIGNHPNWMTDYDVAESVTSTYSSGYSVSASAYTTARIVVMSNWWFNKRAGKTNTVIMSTAISSGFQY